MPGPFNAPISSTCHCCIFSAFLKVAAKAKIAHLNELFQLSHASRVLLERGQCWDDGAHVRQRLAALLAVRGGRSNNEQQPFLPRFSSLSVQEVNLGSREPSHPIPSFLFTTHQPLSTLPTLSIMRSFTVDGMRVSTRASLCSSHSGCSNKIVSLFFAAQS